MTNFSEYESSPTLSERRGPHDPHPLAIYPELLTADGDLARKKIIDQFMNENLESGGCLGYARNSRQIVDDFFETMNSDLLQ